MKSILVTGANGQLGQTIRHIVATTHKCSDYNCFFTDVDELDITDEEAVEAYCTNYKIDIIINCAAYTNVEKAEDDRATAVKINRDGPENLAKVMKKLGGFLIHISTDYVYGEQYVPRPVIEKSIPRPGNIYGHTKHMGENRVRVSCDNYIIIRTSWLYSEYGTNFVKKVIDILKNKDNAKFVVDQVGSPTYAFDLANVILDIIDSGHYRYHTGTYNYSNTGAISWFDFAKSIQEITALTNCDIQSCLSEEFLTKAVRPHYSVMDTNHIRTTFSVDIPYWRTSLEKCLSNLMHQK